MAYSIKADFQKVYSDEKLIVFTRGTGAIVDANLDAAIAKADSIIDSYLKSVIDDLPLVNPPAFIKDYSIAIAVKLLTRGIHYNDIPKVVRTEYEDAIQHLKDISAGKSNIILPAADTTVRNPIIKIDETAVAIFRRDSY